MNAAAQDLERAREEASTWCLRLAEGRLTDEESEEFGDWLSADPRHGPLFHDAVALWEAMEAQASDPSMLALRASALDSIGSATDRHNTRNMGWRWAAPALAAMLVLAIGIGLWLRSLPDIYSTGLGERRVVALSDGSHISLDANSRLEVRYFKDRRDIRLDQGRASFQVAKDPLRPFAVAASGRIVVATGTRFSVEKLDGLLQVALMEGSVAVLAETADGTHAIPIRLDASNRQADKFLTPGKQMSIDLKRSTAQVVDAGPDRATSWESGQLVFADEPLANVVERINRYTARPIILADERLSQMRVSGSFVAGDTPAFLEGMASAFPVRAEEHGETVELVYRQNNR